MLPLFVALLGASHPSQAARPDLVGKTAWIMATVDHSEFCPAGNVRVDLVTGTYDYTAGLRLTRGCGDPKLERPVQHGQLGADQLESLRRVYLKAVGEGLEKPVCRDGARPDEIIFSNGGTPVLVVTTGGDTGSAPEDLSCWSDAATALHEAVDRLFGPDD